MFKIVAVLSSGLFLALAGGASANNLLPTDANHTSPMQFILHSMPDHAARMGVSSGAAAAAQPAASDRAFSRASVEWMRRPILNDGANR